MVASLTDANAATIPMEISEARVSWHDKLTLAEIFR
jgi:hypothetical protein